MNPPIPLPLLVPLLAGVIGLGLFLSWRGSRDAERPWRFTLLALRLLALAGIAVIAFNPGAWISPVLRADRPWVVLRDVSGSMATADVGGTRAALAEAQLALIRRRAEKEGVPMVVRPYDTALLPAPGAKDAAPAPAGKGTDLLAALSQALREADSSGTLPAGVLVLGDGRQTASVTGDAFDSAVMRARSRNVPVDTVVIGETLAPPDLALYGASRLVTAFPGEPLRLPFRLVSTGLAPLRAEVVLTGADGAVLARKTVDAPAGATVNGFFDLVAPQGSTRMRVSTPVVPGEVRRGNNAADVAVRVITSKTRIFLAEGAPYWDSKFLAQLLRNQKHMTVKSVHRIADDRYFRVDSEPDKAEGSGRAVFPETVAELSQYDLVIFGKNVDGFLTPPRIGALRDYVNDGGAVLFARGRPTGADIPALAALEPVVWGAGMESEFRFAPTVDGEAAGLFGESLPAASASLWKSLPALKDARAVAEVKPFTRVLAEGVPNGPGARFPALLVRRHGRGVTGLVNGDGLWKWDFFPEARELGNAYEDFWIQLARWMASYSEFLPGQDWSLRLSAPRGAPGESVSVTLAYRGRETDPAPRVVVTAPGAPAHTLVPAAVRDESGRRVWKSSFTPASPGAFTFTVAGAGALAPETPYAVPEPPLETDDLSPDPVFLEKLAAATGGRAMTVRELPAFLDESFLAAPPAASGGAAVWRPSWAVAPLALAIAFLLAAEWWLRRRRGLA